MGIPLEDTQRTTVKIGSFAAKIARITEKKFRDTHEWSKRAKSLSLAKDAGTF